MKKILIFIILYASLNAITLEDIDNQRMSIDEGSIQVSIVFTNKRGKATFKKYNVLRKDNKNSLVIFAHKSEKGSLVVKEKSNLYIKAGRSSRAIRISPIQRLVGDTSIGDILEIQFKENYKIVKTEEDILLLKALDKTSTYSKIKIYLKKDRLFKADLYSFSGKKLKTIFYETTNNSTKIDRYRFISSKGESIATMRNYKSFKIKKRFFKKRNIKNLYQMSKKYFTKDKMDKTYDI